MKVIYFVHDQLENPFLRQHFLESSGYHVVTMGSGQRCLDLCSERMPSLVLMDVLIEGKNGFEICRAIRKRFAPDELPVILCSEVYRSRLFRDEAISAGAQRYLLKPLRLDELVREVSEVLAVDSQGRASGPAAA
jgi:CheY-like chemotaxis protein